MEPINSITERIARDFIPPENPASPSANPENRFGLGDPNCPICGGLGFIIKGGNDDPTSGVQVPCECRARRFENAGKKARTISANLSGYEQMTFGSFKTEGRGALREEQKTNLEYALKISEDFADNPSGWLFFTGRYGTGKTHLAAAIANDALEKGVEVIFQPVPDLLDQLRMTYGNAGETFEDRFSRIRTVSLLIRNRQDLEPLQNMTGAMRNLSPRPRKKEENMV